MNPVLSKLNDLPIELRAIIEDDEIIQIIDQIGDSFNIPYLWRGELVRATIHILSGLMKPNLFVPFIMEEYDMEQEDALQVALAINERIFSAVKPQLAALHNMEDEKLAHKIKVPIKPRAVEIEAVFVDKPVTSTDLYRKPQMEEQVISPIERKEEVVTTNIAPTISTPNLNTPKAQPIESNLTNKLDSLRVDKYREVF